jgi:hypothetical protein
MASDISRGVQCAENVAPVILKWRLPRRASPQNSISPQNGDLLTPPDESAQYHKRTGDYGFSRHISGGRVVGWIVMLVSAAVSTHGVRVTYLVSEVL